MTLIRNLRTKQVGIRVTFQLHVFEKRVIIKISKKITMVFREHPEKTDGSGGQQWRLKMWVITEIMHVEVLRCLVKQNDDALSHDEVIKKRVKPLEFKPCFLRLLQNACLNCNCNKMMN